MKRALRKESIAHLLPRIILCGLLAVILFGLSGKGLISMVVGPKDLADSTPKKGEYVSFDASDVIVAFANLTAKSDSGTETLKTYYLLPAGDNTYLAVMDRKEHHSDVMDKAMDQSHEYYLGDLETLTQLGTVTGTVTGLDDDMTSYMVDCIEKYTLPGYEEGGDTSALILPLQIDLDRVGLFSKTVTLILGGAGLVFLILMLVFLIPALTGHYQKKAMAEVLKDHTPEEAEELFSSAHSLERVKVGEYLFYQKGATTHAVKVADLDIGQAAVLGRMHVNGVEMVRLRHLNARDAGGDVQVPDIGGDAQVGASVLGREDPVGGCRVNGVVLGHAVGAAHLDARVHVHVHDR